MTPQPVPISSRTTANSSAPCARLPTPIWARSNPSHSKRSLNGFSVRNWIRNRREGGGSHGNRVGGNSVLFLPYRANEIATLRSLISTWMRLAIFEAMSLNESGVTFHGHPFNACVSPMGASGKTFRAFAIPASCRKPVVCPLRRAVPASRKPWVTGTH
jgi:hypothetical protein